MLRSVGLAFNIRKGRPLAHFRDVNRDDLEAVCNLAVAPEQAGSVTPNVMTMAEAQFEPGAVVRALWLETEPVGLLAMMRPSAYPEDEDIVIRRNLAYIWRLMIGAQFQGQGYGACALDEAKRIAKTWNYPGLSLTVADKPNSALPFYEGFGFVPTGRKLWGDSNELEMIWMFSD